MASPPRRRKGGLPCRSASTAARSSIRRAMPARRACRRGCRSVTSIAAARLWRRRRCSTSTDPYFRERTPWRVGTVKLDAGPVVVAHLHGDTVEGGRVRLELKLDKSGVGGRDRIAGEGQRKHGRRSASARNDLRSEIPPRADHRRPQRCRPGDGQGLLGRRRLDRVCRSRRCLEAVSRPRRACARSSGSRSCRST